MEKRLKNVIVSASINSDGLHVDGETKKMPSGNLSVDIKKMRLRPWVVVLNHYMILYYSQF